MKLKNKIVFITGGTRGIGLSLALELIKKEAIVIVGGRNKSVLEELLDKHPSLNTIYFDSLNDNSIINLPQLFQKEFGGLDVLINNAAILYSGNFVEDEFTFEMIDKEVVTNVAAPIKLTKLLLPLIKKSNLGVIVNITSAVANLPMISLPVYSATKAALHSFSISLRQTLKSANIRVIEVQPPLVKTNMTNDLPGKAKDMKMISSEECAESIIQGIIKERETLYIGSSKSLYWASRIMPNMVQKQINKL